MRSKLLLRQRMRKIGTASGRFQDHETLTAVRPSEIWSTRKMGRILRIVVVMVFCVVILHYVCFSNTERLLQLYTVKSWYTHVCIGHFNHNIQQQQYKLKKALTEEWMRMNRIWNISLQKVRTIDVFNKQTFICVWY